MDKVSFLKIEFLEGIFCIKNLQLRSRCNDGKIKNIKLSNHNGIILENNTYSFLEDIPYLIYELPEDENFCLLEFYVVIESLENDFVKRLKELLRSKNALYRDSILNNFINGKDIFESNNELNPSKFSIFEQNFGALERIQKEGNKEISNSFEKLFCLLNENAKDSAEKFKGIDSIISNLQSEISRYVDIENKNIEEIKDLTSTNKVFEQQVLNLQSEISRYVDIENKHIEEIKDLTSTNKISEQQVLNLRSEISRYVDMERNYSERVRNLISSNHDFEKRILD